MGLSLQSQLRGGAAEIPFRLWPQETKDTGETTPKTQTHPRVKCGSCYQAPMSPPTVSTEVHAGAKGVRVGEEGSGNLRTQAKAQSKWQVCSSYCYRVHIEKRKFLNATNILVDGRKLHLQWLIEDTGFRGKI